MLIEFSVFGDFYIFVSQLLQQSPLFYLIESKSVSLGSDCQIILMFELADS